MYVHIFKSTFSSFCQSRWVHGVWLDWMEIGIANTVWPPPTRSHLHFEWSQMQFYLTFRLMFTVVGRMDGWRFFKTIGPSRITKIVFGSKPSSFNVWEHGHCFVICEVWMNLSRVGNEMGPLLIVFNQHLQRRQTDMDLCKLESIDTFKYINNTSLIVGFLRHRDYLAIWFPLNS